MKWLKALQIGLGVINILEIKGVKVKGVPIGSIAAVVEEALTTNKTVDEFVNGGQKNGQMEKVRDGITPGHGAYRAGGKPQIPDRGKSGMADRNRYPR